MKLRKELRLERDAKKKFTQIAQTYLQSSLRRLRKLICNQVYADCANLSAIKFTQIAQTYLRIPLQTIGIEHVYETSDISDV